MKTRFGFAVCGLLVAGCKPEVEIQAAPAVVVGLFDPWPVAPAVAVLPAPNDLSPSLLPVRSAATGLVEIVDEPGASPAALAFNDYLRSLDGASPTAPVRASFSGPLDPARVLPSSTKKGGAVAIVDTTTARVLGAEEYSLGLSDDRRTIVATPHLASGGKPAFLPWRPGHSYLVVIFGGDDPDGLRGADGTTPVVGSRATYFVRGQRPLLSPCPDGDPRMETPACLCPKLAGGYDGSCRVATGLRESEAVLLEGPRRELAKKLLAALPLSGPAKRVANVALVWGFSVAHGPFAAFGPIAGRGPFPSDLYVDSVTGHVRLPPALAAGAAARFAPGLALLDGYSTTGSITVPVDQADDNRAAPPLHVEASSSAVLLDVNALASSPPPLFRAAPQLVGAARAWDGLIALTPLRPLQPDHAWYLGALTSDITDARGRPLRPSPQMALVALLAPLVDESGRSLLPLLLSDAEAVALEGVRKAYRDAGLFERLAASSPSNPSNSRTRVAVLLSFHTQSITQTLRDLASYPAARALPTDVKIVDVQRDAWPNPDAGPIVFGSLRTHLALGNNGAPGATLDLSGGKDVDVPFVLMAPRAGVARGIAIVQHGFGRWRGDLLAIAPALAKAGWASIAIDINFHGARSVCTRAADCIGGCNSDGTCGGGAVVRCGADADCAGGEPGACDRKTGQCEGRLAPWSTLCLTHVEQGRSITECNPTSSGAAFLTLGNPEALRDNLRQHVLDLAQLQRILVADGPGSLRAGLAAQVPPLSIGAVGVGLGLGTGGDVSFVGQSLGAMEGALFLAASKLPATAVLSAPGGGLVDLLAASPTYSPLVSQLLATDGTVADSAAGLQTLDVLRWILDPGDPINVRLAGTFASGDPLKRVIVQEAGRDQVIPRAACEALAAQLGLPLVAGGVGAIAVPAATPGAAPAPISTFFDSASSRFLFEPEASTAAAQAQAVGWIDSAGKLLSSATGR